MGEERRSAPRARISGVRVTYEDAAGDHVETEALNLGRGGLFVRTEKALPVGKRLSLEIQVPGELVPWSALGRIVWARAQTDGERTPAGMGVKLIDVDDNVVGVIDRLVAAGDDAGAEAAPIPSKVPPPVAATSRERTILGVGGASPFGAPPESEPMAAAQPAIARDPSIAIDLIASERKGPVPRRPAEGANEQTVPPKSRAAAARDNASKASAGGASGGRWLVFLVLLAIAGVAAYLVFDGDPDRVPRAPSGQTPPVLPAPMAPTAEPSAAVLIPALSASPTAPTAAASGSASAAPAMSAPSASGSAPRRGPPPFPLPRPAHPAASEKRPSNPDNPY